MSLTILDEPTRTNVAGAVDQVGQLSALIAPWVGGTVTVRHMAGAAVAETCTHGPIVLDSNANRGFTLGPLLASTVNVSGATVTSRVFRTAAGLDVFSLPAADTPTAIPTTLTGRRTNLADTGQPQMTITARASLPVTLPSLALSAVSTTGTVGVAGTATLTNNGSVSCGWSLTSSAGMSATPSSGTLAAGASTSPVLAYTTTGSKTLGLVNGSGGTVTGGSNGNGTSAITVTAAAATTATLALSSTTGATGAAIAGTVTLNGVAPSAGSVTIAGAGATITPTSLSWAAGDSGDAKSITVSRATDGTTSVSITNTMGLANSPAVSYTTILTVGAQIATLAIVNESGTGARPFTSTVLPLRGVVPTGSKISNAAGTETAHILSTHDDGSAAVAVFASTASATGSMAVHVATGPAPAALTAAAISAQVTSVAVAFGGTYGTASLTDFSTPERVWWATSKVICARYRVAAPTPGTTSLEAVIDIQAWSDRAQVEVVVENGKMTTATPTKPTAANYTGVTVSINGGAAIATVDSSAVPTEATHSAFRAWYAAGWVGAGDPGLCVTQIYTELQQHPLLFKCDLASTYNMAGYATDAYTPWSTGRQRASSMGAGGDHASIGPLPQWEAHFLQSGDYRAAKAVKASALALLGYSINYRDTTTGLPPTFTELVGKSMQSNWPSQAYDGTMGFEVAHHPAAGLMAFVCRPSPVFIELAQKISVTVGTWSQYGGTTTGVFGHYYQARGRAWCMRSLAHATFLTPDVLPWKTAGKTSISANVTYMDGWRTDSKFNLGVMCDESVAAPQDLEAGVAGFQAAIWQHHYFATEIHKIASAGLLTGASQTALDTLADWAVLQPVRWVNEQTDGGWRHIGYKTTIGSNATTVGSLSTWGAERVRAGNMGGSPTTVAGTFMSNGDLATSYASYTSDSGNTNYYPAYFWSALCAAVERGVSGAATAWWAVQSGITNITAWRAAGFAVDPRWGAVPKTIPANPSDTSVWGGGNGAAYKGSQTFTALQAVYDGIASTGGWGTLTGTTIGDVMPSNAQLDAIAPNLPMRQSTDKDGWMVWGSAAFNGYGWFATVPGGHLAGNRNDTYVLRVADPPAAIRMHMPSPYEAVSSGITGELLAPADWGNIAIAGNTVAGFPEWGPKGGHQYSGYYWDAATEKMFYAGDAQIYCTNPTAAYGTVRTSEQCFYIFDPYAATPKSAWRRIVPATKDTVYAQGLGVVGNGDGTVSLRSGAGGNPSFRWTVNLTTGVITNGVPSTAPLPESYTFGRHAVRDLVAGKTYELNQIPTSGYGDYPFGLYETTSGAYVLRAVLPSSFWRPGWDNDYQSSIIIHNGRAYVCGQTQAGVSNTIKLGIHQIDVTTFSVQSFTTSPNMSVPEAMNAGVSINGIHGRWGFVAAVGAFVAFPSARANVQVFRPPASWSV